MKKKKHPPEAVCTECGKYWHSILVANKRCNQKYGGKRCQGTFSSAVTVGDWEECTVCDATGVKDEQRCVACQGSGFDFVRKPFP